jgi:transposase-like protein
MAPRKLSDSDKQDITKIYCQPGETTSTVAKKFDVSSSTVSRVLKQQLADDDYAQLMQWKRNGERGTIELSFDVPALAEAAEAVSTESLQNSTEDLPESDPSEESETEEEKITAEETSRRRSRRRSASGDKSDQEEGDQNEELSPTELVEAEEEASPPIKQPEAAKDPKKIIKKSDRAKNDVADNDDVTENDDVADSDVAAWVSEGLAAENDYDPEDDEDDDWDEEEDWDEESEEDEGYIPQPPRQETLAILAFEDFAIKKPCYLVVDRLAELITCPLKEFAELGRIPAEEEQARTLPVFDNHRVARRFARRNQRIIKVPNGLMINKTQEYLQAKGITRLLFEGQVYALN